MKTDKLAVRCLHSLALVTAVGLTACGGGTGDGGTQGPLIANNTHTAVIPPTAEEIATAKILIQGAAVSISPATAQMSSHVLEPTAGGAISPMAVALGAVTSNPDPLMRAAAAVLPNVVYTPANIRAAYNLPPLPASYANLSPAEAAALGAGQTTYVVTVGDNPNILRDLNAFSTKFNLPTCTQDVTPQATPATLATAEIPGVPAIPATPAIAAVPATAFVPEVPGVAAVAYRPATPAVAEVTAVAARAAVPAIPALLAVRARPPIPSIAGRPAIPAVLAVAARRPVAGIPAVAAVSAVAAQPAQPAVAAVAAVAAQPARAAVAAVPARDAVLAVAAKPAQPARAAQPAVAVPELMVASLKTCSLVVAYSMTGPTLTTVPAYNAEWAMETALDVQWIHATAPLARIVVIEAHSANASAIGSAVQVANKFGPGIVNMSLAGAEGVYVNGFETLFKTPGMTYMAAAGDYGSQANWPSTSPSVVAVGGTTLRMEPGTTQRNEVTWQGTGGGISRYFAAPDYQADLFILDAPLTLSTSATPGVKGRIETDVSFNADPATGQYTAFTTPGAASPGWYAMGGTSLATPQWVGIIAIANAQRALSAKKPLADINATLYRTKGFAATDSFMDVKTGNHGTCSYCSAGQGYDIPTGWGSPNVVALLKSFVGL